MPARNRFIELAPDQYERSLEDTRRRSEDCQALINWLSTQDTQILFASTPNIHWQNSIPVLHWIISQERCSKVNAAWIFWFSQPWWYAGLVLKGDKLFDDGSFALACDILTRWRAGLYQDQQFEWKEQADQSEYRKSIIGSGEDPFDLPNDLFGPFLGQRAAFSYELNPCRNKLTNDLFANLGVYVQFEK